MKNEWERFIKNLDINVEFLHKDEFNERFQEKDVKFPIAFIAKDKKLKLFISQNEINKCKTLNELMELVEGKIKTINL
jgi:hypothetical protein